MAPVPDIVLATDEHGVVFLSNDDEWRYRLLEPLPHDQQEVLDTHQYADQAPATAELPHSPPACRSGLAGPQPAPPD